MTTFNLPDLGEGLAEAEIVRWHVNVGDAVTADQPMVAVETAKAVVEVPAPFSGIIKRLHGQPGDIIPTGAPLIEFDTAIGAPTAARTGITFTSAARPDAVDTGTPDAGTVVGSMPTSDVELVESLANTPPLTGRTNPSAGRLRAAPAARALARKLGLDLAQIRGSGRGGVIVVDDVLCARTWDGANRNPVAPDDGVAPQHPYPNGNRPGATAPPLAGGERLRGMRRAMAQSMSLARDNVASCTIFDDADLHRWTPNQDITTRLLRALAAAARAEPALNAWFDGDTQMRRLASQINIGIAVDTPEGLIVPVIRDVGARTPDELRHEIDRLKRAARERTAAPEDLRDATFMLSNFGMIAGRYATPVVVPPTVAILGSGRLTRDVIAVEDRMEAHLRMPLSLTFDHRCVTGGEAARFLAAVLRDLEKDN
jgi:pyruvate dehydrogenase E2 component (dihydrolipoamide acetyltransferase)